MRGPSSSCSLPTLVSDSSPPSDQLSVGGFHAFQSSHDVHSTPYTFRPPSSQLPDRFNQCSYAFVTSPDSSSPNVASYQESPLSLFRSRHPMSDQSALHHESLSTLIAIASTRLDHFEASKADCNYQAVALQPSPVLHDLSMSPDSSQNSEASRESFLDLRQDEHVRTATSSSASSEPRELESHSQCDYSHSRLASPRALSSANLFVDDIDGRQTPVCLSICSENTTKEWHDLNVIGFPKGYQAVKYSEWISFKVKVTLSCDCRYPPIIKCTSTERCKIQTCSAEVWTSFFLTNSYLHVFILFCRFLWFAIWARESSNRAKHSVSQKQMFTP